MRRRLIALIVVVAVLALAVFYRDLLHAAIETNPFGGSPQSISHGKQLFLQDCAVCHGAEGRGDGTATASLPKKPKDLTRIAAPPIFPDGIVAYRIANGGEGMPAWKAVLTPDEIWDLVSYIRSQRR